MKSVMRAVGDRDPEGLAVELALHRLEHEAGGPGGARRGRHDVDGRGPGPAQVAVGAVDQHLVARVGVDGGHQALLDAERVVEHLDHRHEAVGRARGVRHDLVGGAVERVVVDADRRRWRRRPTTGPTRSTNGAPAVEVERGLVAAGEDAGRLDDDVDAEVAPRQLLGVAHGQHLERVAVDLDAVVGGLDVVVEPAEHRVVLEQVGHRLDRTEVVDRHEVDVGPGLLGRPEEVAPDAAEAVDPHADGHVAGPLVWSRIDCRRP